MNTFRGYLQAIFPVCGDLLLGETRIRRQRLAEVNVPKGARVLVSNSQHTLTPSEPEDMKRRRDSLLDKQLPYKLFTQNCEHFATFVRYGKAVCNQVSSDLTVHQPCSSQAQEHLTLNHCICLIQIPGRSKNKESEEAAKAFSDIVWRETSWLVADAEKNRNQNKARL